MWLLVVATALLLLAVAMLVLASAAHISERERITRRIVADPGPADDAPRVQQRLEDIPSPLLREACRRLWSAGFTGVLPAGVVRAGALACAGVLLAVIVLGVAGLVLALALAVGAMLVLAQRKRARRRRINAQMPDFLGYLMRALAAGNTLEQGIDSAAVASAQPIRSVFLSVSRQVRLGASLDEVLAQAARIHELRALHILAMSARVNRRFGGSMRRVIASLIETIRRQEAAARELKALTGETRFSAYVVAAIPVAISLFFYLQNPQYYADMLESGSGRIAIALALLLEAFGLALIWRMMARLQEPDT
jgi:tight adherence protein B